MATAMVIGAQWGDEGKGKIVDYLAAKSGRCCPFPGGEQRGTYGCDRRQSLSAAPYAERHYVSGYHLYRRYGRCR